MKAKKIIAAAVGTVAVLVLAATGFLLYRGIIQLHAVQQNLSVAAQQLDGIYGKNPFPSPGNAKIEKENADLGRKALLSMQELFRKDQVLPDNEKSPSAFISTLGERKKKLTEMAGDAVPDPAKFSFGFGRYFEGGGALPAPDNVPRLTQQLLMIDEICRALFQSKIDLLTSVTREEFEGGTGRAAVAADDPLRNAGKMGQEALSARLHFVFEFSAREKALIGVLNRLASHPLFIVVTSLDVAKEQPDVQMPVKPAPGEEVDSKEVPPQVGQVAVTNAPTTRAMLSGPMLEKPMKVRLAVDVYWFREGEGGQPAAAAPVAPGGQA